MTNQSELIQRFLEVRESIIRPGLVRIEAQLTAEGHEAAIDEASTLIMPGRTVAYTTYAGIRLKVFSADVDWMEKEKLPMIKIPFIVFGVNLSNRDIEVVVASACENGTSRMRVNPENFGHQGSFHPDEVTVELVFSMVDDFLKQIQLDPPIKLQV